MKIGLDRLTKFLIIGGDGTIGKALRAKLDIENIKYFATSRRPESELFFDLSSPPETWNNLPEAEVVFFCAAATKLDDCEKNPNATRIINVLNTQALAEKVSSKGGLIIFLSSNQVFDGSKPYRKADEKTCPINAYGKQKAEFENWLLNNYPKSAILRLTKVIAGRLSIISKWQQKLEAQEEIEVFQDLTFSPLAIESVIEGMLNIANNKKTGIFQLSGKNQLSYYDIACKLADKIGADKKLVKPVSAINAGINPKFLPLYGTLDCSTLPDIFIPEIDLI